MNWTKRLIILLAVSIGVNLTLVGMWIGARWHRGHPRVVSLEHGRGFPPVFESALAGRRAELAARRGAAARARAEAEAVLAKDSLDRPALEAALSRLREETHGSQEIVHRVLVDAAARSASPERRKELGRVLGPGRIGRRGGDFRDLRPGPSAN